MGRRLKITPLVKPVILFVKTLINESYYVDIDYFDTLEIIKERIYLESNIEPEKQRLIYKGNIIDDCQPCVDIEDFVKDGFVHLVIIK